MPLIQARFMDKLLLQKWARLDGPKYNYKNRTGNIFYNEDGLTQH